MKILGIDPGTHCGWALVTPVTRRPEESEPAFKILASGVWNLEGRRHEGGGMRFLRLRQYLAEILDTGADVVAYEEVRSHTRFAPGGRPIFATDAAHVYGGIVAVISSLCEERTPPIPYTGIPVGTVKKYATGKGNASKQEMLHQAQLLDPNIQDDNEADALFIALTYLDNTKPPTPKKPKPKKQPAKPTIDPMEAM